MTADPSLLGRAEPGSFMGIANMGIWAIITHMIIKYIFYCDARQSRQHPHCGESWHLFWFGLGRWRRAATSGLAASGIHCWLAKIVDMSNNIIVVHVSCDFVCHFFLGAIFYALYTCTGYYWMQVQAIRCLVIDAFSLQPSVFFRRPGKKLPTLLIIQQFVFSFFSRFSANFKCWRLARKKMDNRLHAMKLCR